MKDPGVLFGNSFDIDRKFDGLYRGWKDYFFNKPG